MFKVLSQHLRGTLTLKDTLQLKILRQWINIRASSSLVNIMKNKKKKMGEGAQKAISCIEV